MRSTNGPASRKRRKRWLKAAKGFWLRRSKLYRYAKDALDHGRQYAYRDRRNKKREFRALWNVRINAACRAEGIRYGEFMHGLAKAGIELNRKVISELAIHEPDSFKELVTKAKATIKA